MAAAHVFSSSVQPLHHSASPVAGNGGRSGRNRAFFRPSTVRCPGREPASHELPDDFDFQVYMVITVNAISMRVYVLFIKLLDKGSSSNLSEL